MAAAAEVDGAPGIGVQGAGQWQWSIGLEHQRENRAAERAAGAEVAPLGGGASYERGARVRAEHIDASTPVGNANRGMQMLERMGWKRGTPLGTGRSTSTRKPLLEPLDLSNPAGVPERAGLSGAHNMHYNPAHGSKTDLKLHEDAALKKAQELERIASESALSGARDGDQRGATGGGWGDAAAPVVGAMEAEEVDEWEDCQEEDKELAPSVANFFAMALTLSSDTAGEEGAAGTQDAPPPQPAETPPPAAALPMPTLGAGLRLPMPAQPLQLPQAVISPLPQMGSRELLAELQGMEDELAEYMDIAMRKVRSGDIAAANEAVARLRAAMAYLEP